MQYNFSCFNYYVCVCLCICVFVSVLAKIIIWNTFFHAPEPHQVLFRNCQVLYLYIYVFMYTVFFISLCNRPFTQCFLSMLSCHWYLIWSIWNNPKNISKRRFQGCRRETCRRASPPENVQIIQRDMLGTGTILQKWRNKIIWFVTAISPHIIT